MYKKYISFSNQNVMQFNFYYTCKNFKIFTKYLKYFISNSCTFLFITVNKDIFYFSHLYKFLQKKINSYFVYDWIFGVISNYQLIYDTYERREQILIHKQPCIGILTQTKFWTKIIINELKTMNTFCMGVVDALQLKFVDFPILLPNFFESGFFVLNFFLRYLSSFKLKEFNKINV